MSDYILHIGEGPGRTDVLRAVMTQRVFDRYYDRAPARRRRAEARVLRFFCWRISWWRA